jgi:heme A synthase
MADVLHPMWAPIIGVLTLVAVVVAGGRLAVRGPSRMTRALATMAAVVLVIMLVGVLTVVWGG